MAFKFFYACTTLDEVKKLYKILAKEHHPDKGGDIAVMQQVNAEYKKACISVINGSQMSAEEKESTILSAEAYKNAIDAIINLEGIYIELVGAWIWVTGKTWEYSKVLKGAGFMFASKKKAWYFRSEENKVNNHKPMSLEAIKGKYGSELITSSKSQSYRLQAS